MPGKTRSRRAREPPSQDTDMMDAPASAQQLPLEESQEEISTEVPAVAMEEDENEEEDGAPRVRILPGSTDTAASFEFLEEGHTLGNALRYIIMKNPNVEFCAYTIPHPSEAKMNVRIQTYEGTAVEALSKGLEDLQKLCDVVAHEFWTKRNEFMGIEEESVESED